MRPRNQIPAGSSNPSKAALAQDRYKRTLNYKNEESTNRIIDVLDEKTFKMFENMKGVVWQHTILGHTIKITPMEASRLLSNGIKGVTVRV